MTRASKTSVLIAILVAFVIASAAFATGQVFGEGAGVPVMMAATTLWVPFFVARRRKKLRQ